MTQLLSYQAAVPFVSGTFEALWLPACYDQNPAPALEFHEAEPITGADCTKSRIAMKAYTVVIERCPETGFYVGSVPGFPGAHSQGESLDELRANMREVIAMLLEDATPHLRLA